jgi:ribonuclease HI
MMNMIIEVYTDGSATTSDKPGGYGWVMVIDGKKYTEGSGHLPLATNNDAELEAALMGLVAAKHTICIDYDLPLNSAKYEVVLVSDSQLILGWVNGTYAFRQTDKLEKYKELRLLAQLMGVKTRWVEGHTGDEHNERCDRLANAARLQVSIDQVKEAKKSKKESMPDKDFVVYLKENLKLYVHYKGKIKEIDLENNSIIDYNQ